MSRKSSKLCGRERRGIHLIYTYSYGYGQRTDVRVVVIAGDISPEDVISHLPVMCEDHSVPYIFTPSKLMLGLASLTKRPTSVIMVKEGGKEAERVEELGKEVKKEMKAVVFFA